MEPFIGQIILVAFNYAPEGWALCNGQLMQVSQNQALYALLGTNYGGDGKTTFGLPDLRGRVPIHFGQGTGLSNHDLGQKAGVERVTLNTTEMPMHNHVIMAGSNNKDTYDPKNALFPTNFDNILSLPGDNAYLSAGNAGSLVQMNSANISGTGGSQSHENMPPFIALNYIIALYGNYPARP